MLIIPAIDLIQGRCVRLFQGDFNRVTEYPESPVDIARHYEQEGASLIHIVDLDGARQGKPSNTKTIQAIRETVSLPLEVGGGLRTKKAIREIFSIGVNRIVVSDIALYKQRLLKELMETYGPDKIIVGLDAKEGVLQSKGWTQQVRHFLDDFLVVLESLGVRTIIYTDIARDGTLTSPPIAVYERLVQQFPSFSWIASGGISQMEDILKLNNIKVQGVLIGKALLEKTLSIPHLQRALQNQ